MKTFMKRITAGLSFVSSLISYDKSRISELNSVICYCLT